MAAVSIDPPYYFTYCSVIAIIIFIINIPQVS